MLFRSLQRYAITLSLLCANPAINRGTLEKESRNMAQRLSVLHGINAPEFFDKAVFSTLVATLRTEGYITDSAETAQGDIVAIYNILGDLITPEVRLTIESASSSADMEANNQLGIDSQIETNNPAVENAEETKQA